MRRELSNRQVPDNVIQLLEHCLDEEAEDRLANGLVLARAVKKVSAQLPQPKGATQPA